MATLETGQDPLHEASEHCEDTSQRCRENIATRRENVATRRVEAQERHDSQRTVKAPVEALELQRGSGLVSELCLPHFSESGI